MAKQKRQVVEVVEVEEVVITPSTEERVSVVVDAPELTFDERTQGAVPYSEVEG